MKKIKNYLFAFLCLLPCLALLSACGEKPPADTPSNPSLKDFTGIQFNSLTVDYDGNEHEIVITGTLPETATVSYENNKGTNAGTYKAVATLTCEGYNTKTLKADLVIKKISYDMSQVKWDYTEPFTYDESQKEVKIATTSTLPEGVSVKEYTNNKQTNAGEYVASVSFNYDTVNHNAPTIKDCNWKINKATYNMEGINWNYTEPFTYDSNPKEVKIANEDALPKGLTVKEYSNNKKTDFGEYVASVTFNYDTTNYNKPQFENCNWKINKATLTNITFEDLTVEYNTELHSIELVGDIPADSVVKITYDGEVVDGMVEVGTYTAKLLITNKNYNDYTATATLKITSTDEQLYSASLGNNIYFQNNLDSNKLYKITNDEVKKVNNDIPTFLMSANKNLYYNSSSLFSSVIKSFNGTVATPLYETKAEYLTSDGTYLYYSINNLIVNTDLNGIYKIKLDGKEEPKRLVQNKAAYLVYYDNNIYYSNLSDGKKLYVVSTTANNLANGTQLIQDFNEKVEFIIQDNGVLYFNSTKTAVGVPTASAIRKYVIATKTNIKLTTDSGKYLTKMGDFIFYINNDKLTSNLFGDGIYKVNSNTSEDSSLPGLKIVSCEDNGYSSLTSLNDKLYFYKLNDKHFYSYDLGSATETDLMANFKLPVENIEPTGFAHLAEYRGEIYFTNPLDDGCLYKYNKSSKKQYKVLSNSVSNVYFHDNFMYYSTYISVNYALWRMDLTTKETTKISSSRCDNLIFADNKIYYVKVGSFYNNHIMSMDLDGSNVQELYTDKNLWVASFQKVNDDLYFTSNTSKTSETGKIVYKYNIKTNKATALDLPSTYIAIENNILYYYNHKSNTIASYNLETQEQTNLIQNVDVNNMIVANGSIFYSSIQKGNIGLFEYKLSTKENKKLSNDCADGMLYTDNTLYFLQTAISYTSDYPHHSNGTGQLQAYDGQSVKTL